MAPEDRQKLVDAIVARKGQPPYFSEAWEEDRLYSQEEENFLDAEARLLTAFVQGEIK